MHGLVLKTVQVYVQDTYGPALWSDIASAADLDVPDFEAMLNYDEDVFSDVLRSASELLKKPGDAFLEDMGTYLVSHPNCEGLRRLLRFGGVDFIEFLHSLDDLPGRARLVIADLVLPDLELQDFTANQFQLRIEGHLPGFVHVMAGLLRAMADDYGTLALLDHQDNPLEDRQLIDITVIETAYAAGRDFELAGTQKMGEAS